ncbi:hypothetical protein OGAPHI_000184 [Ogataea philodendri]|uniref:Aminotransferase class I/classII large domain-containing protein n=1 Tax=Ogataea philodendri TaxID=1378263 RepID=A0A9P8PGL4_9ASCO|nr:uncharacterized protein OGAPHI_000184 [Ogataea philodendri]KAH3671482.1 hypothetical protein OGAPHI_000184 [Ogataea philodendri]
MSTTLTKISAFSHLRLQPADEMNDLKVQLARDTDPNKVNVSAGVYRGADDKVIMFPVVKKAKEKLGANDPGHDYTFCMGIPEYLNMAAKLAVGEEILSEKKVASCQTVGGTGACHMGAKLLTASGHTEFYVGTPTWPNYKSLIKEVGGNVHYYNHLDPATKKIAWDVLMNLLKTVPERSVFVFQLVCHNPTGTDYSKDQWLQIIEIMKMRNLIPFIDGAYQGFASGSIEEDGWATREFAKQGLELIMCQSFSKNLGLYSERVGALHVVSDSPENSAVVADNIRYLFRAEASSAPAYGARIMIESATNDMELWKEDIRNAVADLNYRRKTLHNYLTTELKTPGNWDTLLSQKGLFWYSGLSADQCAQLRDKHHVYLPSSGRVNVACLNESNFKLFASAFDEVVRG